MERIGAYVVERELARGGMGVVYVARHVELGRRVALKLLLGQDDPEAVQRFLVEAQALAQLQHPNVVRIHEIGHDAGRPFLVMDLIDGTSLQDRLDREGPLEPREAAALIEQLARALDDAHRRGILHRDMKPANVLVERSGRPLITDFGLAKDLTNQRERLTQTGAMLGTPGYMPPEQADGDPDAIDGRADVYSLGATLYALLTGRPPFGGGTLINIINAVLTKRPPPPSQLRSEVERDLETICLKCLEKEPGDRYGSAATLADDLARYLRQVPILAQPPTWQRKLRMSLQRNKQVVSGTAGALVLISGVLGVGLAFEHLTQRPAPRTAEPIKTLRPRPRKTTRAPLPKRDLRVATRNLRNATRFEKRGDWARAVEELEKALEGDASPENTKRCARAHFKLSDQLRQVPGLKEEERRRRIDAALSRCLKLDPAHYRARAVRAREAIEGARTNHARALEDFTYLLKHPDLRPLDEPVFQASKGQCLHVLSRHPEALEELDAAIAKATALNRDQKVQAYLFRARTRRALQRYEGAIADFEKVLELRPDSRRAGGDLANLQLTVRGDPKAALGVITPAIESDERALQTEGRARAELSKENYALRAQALTALGQHAGAAQDYRRVIQISRARTTERPTASDYLNLATALFRANEFTKSLEAFLQAKARSPAKPSAAWANCETNIGLCQLGLEQWDRAKQTFEAVLAVTPQSNARLRSYLESKIRQTKQAQAQAKKRAAQK